MTHSLRPWLSCQNISTCTSLFGPGLQNLYLLLVPGPQVFWHFPHVLHAVQVPSTFGLGEVVVVLPKGRTVGRTIGPTVEVETTPVPTLPPPPAPVFSPVLLLDPSESVPGLVLPPTAGLAPPDIPPNSFSFVGIDSANETILAILKLTFLMLLLRSSFSVWANWKAWLYYFLKDLATCIL